jgi:uncharacterized Ntn-hydrolase superfamily protein
MKKLFRQCLNNYKLFLLTLLLWLPFTVQATMSIVAVDPVTGKVGSAGFTCICNFNLRNYIALVVPGKGVFNAQASTSLGTYPNTQTYLTSGYNAFELLNANIAYKGDINVTQILAATLNPGTGLNTGSSPNAFAFTGNGNGNVNYYRYGQNFAIAGNILISKAVLDDAYNAFLNTPGELEDKLMAALLAAKRPGADSRCLSADTSSHVAYISVAKPNDPIDHGFLELQYINPCGVNKEPVDILNTMFINWKRANAGLPPISIPVLNITSITTNRQPSGDRGYTLDGDRMIDARAKLLNADNFGMYGYTQAKVNITDAFAVQGSMTQTALNNLSTDMLFIGSFNKTILGAANGFTPNEINEVYNWSLGNNKTVFLFESGADWSSFFSKWGYEVTPEVSNPNKQFAANSTLDVSKKIFNGPFRNVAGFNQGGGLQGYFSKMPSNAIVLAVNNSNKPVLVFDCNTKDIICADTDAVTALGGITAGNVVTNDNDRFLANLINLALEIKNNQITLPVCGSAAKQAQITDEKPTSAILSDNIEEMKVYPNPAGNSFTIDLHIFKNQKLNIDLYNQNYILLRTKSVLKKEDKQTVKIDAHDLPEGVLYVVVSDQENKKVTQKLIIKH